MANSFEKTKRFMNKAGVIHTGSASAVDSLVAQGMVTEIKETPLPTIEASVLTTESEPKRRKRKTEDVYNVESESETANTDSETEN